EPTNAEFFEGRDAYFADPEGNYWEIAWAPDTNPVVAAARAASQPLHHQRYATTVTGCAGDTAPIRLIDTNSAPTGPPPATRRTGSLCAATGGGGPVRGADQGQSCAHAVPRL